jgi:CRISPR-associated protein Csx16
MAGRRLVSFLGMGPLNSAPPHYTPVCYEIDGRRSEPTPLLERAIRDLEDVNSIVVLGTEEVEKRWITTRLFDEIVGQPYDFRRMPHGATPGERWALFQSVVDALDPEALEAAGETAPPDEIIMDVTHGFRSQPLLGVAAASFALSEWMRRRVETPPTLRLLYGAWDARNPETNVAPVWDLTEFVAATRWNSALDAFMRYGRADEIASLGRQDSRARRRCSVAAGVRGAALHNDGAADRFGNAAKAFADDLALARLKSLFTSSAPRLRELLQGNDARTLCERLPPLRGTIEQLRNWIDPLCAPNVLGPEGLHATAELAELYGRLQRFAEQAATVREGLITHYGLATGRGPAPEPGVRGCLKSREMLEDAWRRFSTDTAPADGLEANWKCSKAMGQVRNDVEHCGIRDQPLGADRLREQLQQNTRAFRDLVKGAADQPGVRTRAVFLNLSNHPVASWPAEQIHAARALCLGEPTDLDGGMPQVPPDAREDEVRRIADEIVNRAVDQRAAGVYVAGEYALSFLLVTALQSRGIRCFTATTHREVVENRRADGSTVVERVYRFVQWREYPRLAAAQPWPERG